MTPIEFIAYMDDKDDPHEYGLCPPPLPAQEAINILCKHLLGPDWYTTLPLPAEQCNTEIVWDILEKYPEKRQWFRKRRKLNERRRNENCIF